MAIYRPPFIKQLDGSTYGGQNCTMASAAMAAVRHRRGTNPPGTPPWYPTPSYLRRMTGDKSGGTTLAQADVVLNRAYGINLDVEYNIVFSAFRQRIMSGQGAIVQGGYAPIRGTKFSGSRTFGGNHAVYINEVRWNEKYDRWEYLWYDPLCDGRQNYPRGPQWIPESLVLKFTNALMITSVQRIGANRVYAAFTRDTETVIFKFGATPYVAVLKVRSASKVRVRRAPNLSSTIVLTLLAGASFRAYQRTISGPLYNGSRHWYGDADGMRWVPHGGMTRVS